MRFTLFVFFICLGLAPGGIAAADAGRAVLLISIDGLRPDYVTDANRHGLKIPELRRLWAEGAHASSVRGVLPTITYPSHTTLVTGVSPARHGIGANRPFSSPVVAVDVYYSFAEDILVPTLWDVVAQAGFTSGSVSWPVTAGSASIQFNIPEYHLTRTDEDIRITRGMATPNLMRELGARAGPFITDATKAVPRDWARTRHALEIIRQKGPRLLTVHLAATDHYQHRDGPFTSRTLAALEEIDRMVAQLGAAMRERHPRVVVCIASDHGFASVGRFVYLDSAFVKAGLIRLKTTGKTVADSTIESWVARPWSMSGSAGIVLNNPQDTAARERVKVFLDQLAADPANGIAAVHDEAAIREQGGTSQAQFWVDMRPGFQIAPTLAPSIVAVVSGRGTHGYGPDHPDMGSSFAIAGDGVRRGLDLGRIDMRSIAPTLARAMGLSLPSAEKPPLAVFVAE